MLQMLWQEPLCLGLQVTQYMGEAQAKLRLRAAHIAVLDKEDKTDSGNELEHEQESSAKDIAEENAAMDNVLSSGEQ